MRSYEVRVTPSAMAQIWDAVRYVRDELCMPQSAARLLDEIEGAVRSLSSMPNVFHAVHYGTPSDVRIRRIFQSWSRSEQ